VLQVLPGFGETAGQALGRHMDVDMMAFTGSTQVGKYFLRYAGESNMKHVSLETGGKSPNIVFADAGDLNHIAKVSADGVFFNAGQSCNAPTRILVSGDDQGRVHRPHRQACKALDARRPARPQPRWARWSMPTR
jgi:acyl-CoA reductase-like NAD-dependent aldehyde dehydrogenase